MAHKIRILIITDSPALPSGLAETTRLIFENLLDQYPGAYELHQIALFHCYAMTQPRWQIYPTATGRNRQGEIVLAPDDRYGQKSFARLLPRIRPDILFVFGDPHRVRAFCLPANQREHRLILYLNFDGMPLPPGYAAALENADVIFTKTEFSLNVLASALQPESQAKLRYMYSPADVQRFRPMAGEERAEARNQLFPNWMPKDAFVLGWVGRNQWRKQVWALYKAIHYVRTGEYLVCGRCGQITLYDWDPSMQTHVRSSGASLEAPPAYGFDRCVHCLSEDVRHAEPLPEIFLWCHMAEEPEEGWPLQWLEEQWGLQRNRDVYYTPDYGLKSALAQADMPTLYNLWDCLLFLSGGEGFGLPVWEAMSSGIPVVYTNYSAHGELATRGNAGLPVSGILQPDRSCIWRMIADTQQVIKAIRTLYYDRGLAGRLGANGRRFTEQFAPETQIPRWHEVFQQVFAQGQYQRHGDCKDCQPRT